MNRTFDKYVLLERTRQDVKERTWVGQNNQSNGRGGYIIGQEFFFGFLSESFQFEVASLNLAMMTISMCPRVQEDRRTEQQRTCPYATVLARFPSDAPFPFSVRVVSIHMHPGSRRRMRTMNKLKAVSFFFPPPPTDFARARGSQIDAPACKPRGSGTHLFWQAYPPQP